MNSTDPVPGFTVTPHRPAAADAGPAERLLAELRTEIAQADSKASILVAVLGMTAGVFSGLLAGRNWSPGDLSGLSTVIWWTGSLAFALALIALLLAVLPRYGSARWRPGQALTYFGDVQQAARTGQLTAALSAAAEQPAGAGLTTALTETSRIAALKHRWIRAGLITFSFGTVLLPASLLIG
ncbi:Pycsar system effector family protein [Streptomyces sp. CAU 1734]|uniref:Pycsar system effector family protein n=1 Tax=Streptomyces sp. CAU 1734 TaxID=3140360 RepID=UPI0032616052